MRFGKVMLRKEIGEKRLGFILGEGRRVGALPLLYREPVELA